MMTLQSDLIDLGRASQVTQGPGGAPVDEALGMTGAGLLAD